MAQPSVAQYFNTRKRPATNDHKIDRVRKVLKLDQEQTQEGSKITPNATATTQPKIISNKELAAFQPVKSAGLASQCIKSTGNGLKIKKVGGSTQDIQDLLNNMRKVERCVTPPNQCEKQKVTTKEADELQKIKKKVCRSAKLDELKASIKRFKESADQLKVIEKKTAEISQSPTLKTFKSLEFEVSLSPQKVQSPEKLYLSPRKDSLVRRNLLSALSPTKNSACSKCDFHSKDITESPTKPILHLPFKYRTFNEVFRATDTVAQILYNRKEILTFKKLKPAVQEMLKRNYLQKHVAQIKFIYPDAYKYTQEKVKVFGTGMRQEQWELVLTPILQNEGGMTSQVLLERRRNLHELLINKVKEYHNEFLLSLTPPMIISKDNITRWHPEFDIEKVPDLEVAELPQPPFEEKYSSGKEVLEKARQMFNCNTRMENALSKLKELHERIPTTEQTTTVQPNSILKGIPKALLEKVRQKQAAKALLSMTRSEDKEKELQMYARLPEIARLTRSLFVTEKKGVLELDTIVSKLGNSYRCFLSKVEIEEHLKAISKEVPDWLVFHKLRNSVFLKLAKNADLSIVLSKLEKLAKQKNES